MPSTFGYWDLRGLGEQIRLLLAYAGEDYTYKKYELDENIEKCRDVWLKDKFNLDLSFPNLPFYIDDKVKLSQSVAIMRYLGRKYNLNAKNEDEKIAIEMVEQHIQDVRTFFVNTVYSPAFDQMVKYFDERLPNDLKLISDFLKDKTWLVGTRLTYVDFMAFDVLDVMRFFKPEIFKGYPRLAEYLERFRSVPQIKAFIGEGKFKKWPVTAPIAQWGYHNPPADV